jgi:hypothetical protein
MFRFVWHNPGLCEILLGNRHIAFVYIDRPGARMEVAIEVEDGVVRKEVDLENLAIIEAVRLINQTLHGED